MAGNKLTSRVEALEQREGIGARLPAVWIVCDDDETADDACVRYEAEHGLIGDRMSIIWCPVSDPVRPCA